MKLCSNDSYDSAINKIILTLTDEQSDTIIAQCRFDDSCDLPHFNIYYNESISSKDASLFFLRVLNCISSHLTHSSFVVTFRLCNCPKWAEEYHSFCKETLKKYGLSPAYNDNKYAIERILFQIYIKQLICNHTLNDDIQKEHFFIVIDDFYMDLRGNEKNPIILGDIQVYFNTNIEKQYKRILISLFSKMRILYYSH